MCKDHDPSLSNPLQLRARLGHAPAAPRYLPSQTLRLGYPTCTHDQHACAKEACSAGTLWSERRTGPAKYKDGNTPGETTEPSTEMEPVECVLSPQQPQQQHKPGQDISQLAGFLSLFRPRSHPRRRPAGVMAAVQEQSWRRGGGLCSATLRSQGGRKGQANFRHRLLPSHVLHTCSLSTANGGIASSLHFKSIIFRPRAARKFKS